ncbi:MAG: hypothetical protein HY348_02215 [Nitrospira defluvii]|nr:hypothetical protein [Nitrospira defluvii]
MQPKLKSKVRCSGSEVGEVRRVVMDPLSHEVSHLAVGGAATGLVERQVPVGQIQAVTDDAVTLRCTSAEFSALPVFRREDYVTTHEVEIAHLEDRIHVTPGEVLVPFPELERSVKRRTFFANFTHAIGFLIGLPLAFPVLRYLMKPMYSPFDNQWLKIGNSGKIKQDDVGFQFKY